VSVGSTLGACSAFLIARYGARDKVAAMASGNRHFGAIDRAIGEGGWKIVALLRLSPAIPFNLQNYLYGLTPVRFWPYAVTSWIAMLPATFLYVYIGHVTGAAVGADRERTTAEWAMLAVGLLATAVVTVYVTRLANRKLKEQVQDAPQNAPPAASEPANLSAPPASKTYPTVLMASAALILVAIAIYTHLYAGSIQRKLASLWGPPPVEMREAYSATAAGPTMDHAALDALLKKYVDDDGWVDYEGLSGDTAKLDDYLSTIAAAPFDQLGRDEKLALLINAYNASALKLILDHMPIDSIMDIPESQRWDAVRWNLGGQQWSLNQLEHERIRAKFAEPRVHFALVCAAVGCPPLRNEAYVGDRIEEQLQEQAEYVHDHKTWFTFDPSSNRLALTKLYDWYSSDFEQFADSVSEFAARYSPELVQTLQQGTAPQLDWLPYDWKLNGVRHKQPR
ncbi:MAG: DUF547 domain-containing protein, partial [Novipirellula sp. JB048]